MTMLEGGETSILFSIMENYFIFTLALYKSILFSIPSLILIFYLFENSDPNKCEVIL